MRGKGQGVAILAERYGIPLAPIPYTIFAGAKVEPDKESGSISVKSMKHALSKFLTSTPDPAYAILTEGLKHRNDVVRIVAKDIMGWLKDFHPTQP